MIKDQLIQDVLFQRLQPLAVQKYWNLISAMLIDSLQGQTAATGHVVRLMAAVQDGRIQVWSALAHGDKPVLVGMLFTQIMSDPFLGTSELLIYGLNMRAALSQEAYAHCLSEIESYAKQMKCQSLRAQTDKNGVKRLLQSNGWSNGVCTLTKEI